MGGACNSKAAERSNDSSKRLVYNNKPGTNVYSAGKPQPTYQDNRFQNINHLNPGATQLDRPVYSAEQGLNATDGYVYPPVVNSSVGYNTGGNLHYNNFQGPGVSNVGAANPDYPIYGTEVQSSNVVNPVYSKDAVPAPGQINYGPTHNVHNTNNVHQMQPVVAKEGYQNSGYQNIGHQGIEVGERYQETTAAPCNCAAIDPPGMKVFDPAINGYVFVQDNNVAPVVGQTVANLSGNMGIVPPERKPSIQAGFKDGKLSQENYGVIN